MIPLQVTLILNVLHMCDLRFPDTYYSVFGRSPVLSSAILASVPVISHAIFRRRIVKGVALTGTGGR